MVNNENYYKKYLKYKKKYLALKNLISEKNNKEITSDKKLKNSEVELYSAQSGGKRGGRGRRSKGRRSKGRRSKGRRSKGRRSRRSKRRRSKRRRSKRRRSKRGDGDGDGDEDGEFGYGRMAGMMGAAGLGAVAGNYFSNRGMGAPGMQGMQGMPGMQGMGAPGMQGMGAPGMQGMGAHGIMGMMGPTSIAHGMVGGPMGHLEHKINKLGEKVELNKEKINDARLESMRGDMMAVGLAAK